MSSKVIFGALALLLLGGDDDDADAVPPVPLDPNLPTPLGPIQVFPTSWTPPAIPVFPGTPVAPFEGPGGEEPQTLGELFDELLSPVPAQGRLWRVVQGTNPTTALQQAYGEVNSFIWACFTQTAWNWKLYGVEGAPGTSYSHPVEGTLGQVTSAWVPMHEPVATAIAFGRLPQRTILWNKGSNGQVQPRNVAGLPQPLAGAKTWGTVYFPREVDCAETWTAPNKNPSQLFASVGTTAADWDAWA